MLTAERLKELLNYDPISGLFTWIGSPRCGWNGKAAGSTDSHGYIAIRVEGNDYKAHRLAVLFMTGVWPTRKVERDNSNRSDNRWLNISVKAA